MGRIRRIPKDDKEAKELERLRKNQAACRKRRLDKIDDYKKTIDELENLLKQKFQEHAYYIDQIDQLRVQMAHVEQYPGSMVDSNTFQAILQEVDRIQKEVEEMKKAMKSADNPDAGPSTSQ